MFRHAKNFNKIEMILAMKSVYTQYMVHNIVVSLHLLAILPCTQKSHSLTAQDVVLAIDLGIAIIIHSFSSSSLTGLANLAVQTAGERPILASLMSEWQQGMDYV